ncbi:DUF2254 domain-containing protein [Hyalangium sp.]|uniref:DUF2254 domain-containing protein n=1 Tax=Hyalangium sp. TaxID=2028555 RepID=UPI002D3C09A9|nr:DUF2254 domain-containing protein [Hyalangium sp.]HYH97938.1 DUF2254 domain-containing protein [Hyalangium sp.]
MRRLQLARIRMQLQTSLWTSPALAVVAALVLAQALQRVDSQLGQEREAWFLFGGGAESARELLSTIASSLLTFTGLVFSVTILVLQLASSQFSSRVLRTFLEDRFTRFSMGVFIGSFVYAMVLLPEVRAGVGQEPEFVPALSIFVAFLLVLLSVGVFVHYIHHMAHSIRAVHVVFRVAEETRKTMETLYPEGALKEPVDPTPLPSGAPDQSFAHDRPPGVVAAVEEQVLMRLACTHGVVIALVPLVGDFLPRGAPLFQVWGKSALRREELREAVVVAKERTPHQDVAFGLRQLVDVAERALSPGINDPTTAVQALDQIHDLLRMLALRPFPAPTRVDATGQLRLILPRPDWEAFVRLSLDEIREYGEGSLQVMRRMRAVLTDLLTVAPASRRGVLEEQLSLLTAASERSFQSEVERRLAETSSSQGHGEA